MPPLACARCRGHTFCYLDLFRHVCYISFSWCYCVCLKHNPLCNCLCSSSFLPAVSGTSKFKLVFLILKIWKCGGLKCWVQHFPRYSCKIWYNNWYLYFCKTTKFGKQAHLQDLTQMKLIKQVLVTKVTY